MAYQSWHNYGYGICVSEITTESIERLKVLLSHAPVLQSAIHTWLMEDGITEPCYEDYMAYDETFMLDLASILSDVIQEAEGIRFTACSNYDDDRFLIYQPSYLWEPPEGDASLTKEKLDEILRKYISILTDEEIEIDYQSVENDG